MLLILLNNVLSKMNDIIDINDIISILKHLMKKHYIKQCLDKASVY